MRYSAMIWAEFRKFEWTFGAGLSIQHVKVFWERRKDGPWREIVAQAIRTLSPNLATRASKSIPQCITQVYADWLTLIASI